MSIRQCAPHRPRATVRGDAWRPRKREDCSLVFRARIAEDAETLARLEAQDCGKPMKQARADAAACARYFEFYGGASDKLHGETIPYSTGFTVLTWREPHGVTGHIIPWNYPLQIFGARWPRRSPSATRAWSSPRKMPACRCCASPS
jgi:aldehyde dehydrogenase (NAD+)